MSRSYLVQLAAVVIISLVSPLQATLVVPSANASVEGNGNNLSPFSIANVPPGLQSQRYQQVYTASEFGVSPVVIHQILFRPDATAGSPFNRTLPDIQINFSTTARNPDALSPTFADNVGLDDMIVVPRGPLTLFSADTAGPGNTRAFDIVISLTTPFVYNPVLGNLLLDVRNFSGGTTTPFDAVNSADSVSRSLTLVANGVGLTSGSTDSLGLVTAFNFVAIPEASALAICSLFVLGCAVFCTGRRRRAA